jgi:hypothetical protein
MGRLLKITPGTWPRARSRALLALSLILLVYSGLSARHTEISYGE